MKFGSKPRPSTLSLVGYINRCGEGFWPGNNPWYEHSPHRPALFSVSALPPRSKTIIPAPPPHSELKLYKQGEVHTESEHCEQTAWNAWHVIACDKTQRESTVYKLKKFSLRKAKPPHG